MSYKNIELKASKKKTLGFTNFTILNNLNLTKYFFLLRSYLLVPMQLSQSSTVKEDEENTSNENKNLVKNRL